MAKRKSLDDAPAQTAQEPPPTFGYCCQGCRQLIMWDKEYRTLTPALGKPHDCQEACAAFVTMMGVRWRRPRLQKESL